MKNRVLDIARFGNKLRDELSNHSIRNVLSVTWGDFPTDWLDWTLLQDDIKAHIVYIVYILGKDK